MSGLYTNTGKVGSIVGLVVTTLLVSYVASNSTKLVNDTVSLAKKGVWKVRDAIEHKKQKQQYCVWARDFDGKIYDTGRKVWK